VQCALARRAAELLSEEDCEQPDCPACQERRLLLARERDLLEPHRLRWASLDPNPGDATRVTWRRGFVEQLACHGPCWVACADSLLRQHPLRAVDLLTWPLLETHEDPNTRTVRARFQGQGDWPVRLDERNVFWRPPVFDWLGTRLLLVCWPTVRFTVRARLGGYRMEVELTPEGRRRQRYHGVIPRLPHGFCRRSITRTVGPDGEVASEIIDEEILPTDTLTALIPYSASLRPPQ